MMIQLKKFTNFVFSLIITGANHHGDIQNCYWFKPLRLSFLRKKQKTNKKRYIMIQISHVTNTNYTTYTADVPAHVFSSVTFTTFTPSYVDKLAYHLEKNKCIRRSTRADITRTRPMTR